MEYILCSAIWYKDLLLKRELPDYYPVNVNKGIIFYGFRHLQCIRQLNNVLGLKSVQTDVGEYIQGFLTSKNRFVDREEAMEIAKSAKQVIRKNSSPRLYSEDLY